MICISLGKIEFNAALAICENESLVEIRADLNEFSDEQFRTLMNAGARVVFTCRKGSMDEQRRLDLYRNAIEKNVAFLDLDIREDGQLLESVKQDLKKADSELILSYHNYEYTPSVDELKRILKDIYHKGADIAKIACLVKKDADSVNLLSLYRKPGRKVILGMGETGMITRVAAVFMGSEFTFAFPDGETKTAAGQLSKKEFEKIFSIMRP